MVAMESSRVTTIVFKSNIFHQWPPTRTEDRVVVYTTQDLLAAVLQDCTATTFKLEGVDIEDDVVQEMITALANMQLRLTTFVTEAVCMSTPAMDSVYDMLCACPNLVTLNLNLSMWASNTKDQAARFAHFLELLPSLTVLTVCNVHLSPAHQAKLVRGFNRHAPTLQTVVLDAIGRNSMEGLSSSVLQSICNCTHLRKLQFSKFRLHGADVGVLGQGIASMPMLLTLILDAMYFDNSNISVLAPYLGQCVQLRVLQLTYHVPGPEGIRALCSILPNLQQLEALNLQAIEAPGQRAMLLPLAEVLPLLPKLRHLNLSNNKCTRETIIALGQAIVSCPRLVTLHLLHIASSTETVDCLVRTATACSRLQQLSLDRADCEPFDLAPLIVYARANWRFNSIFVRAGQSYAPNNIEDTHTLNSIVRNNRFRGQFYTLIMVAGRVSPALRGTAIEIWMMIFDFHRMFFQ
jgi:hypothetical protein